MRKGFKAPILSRKCIFSSDFRNLGQNLKGIVDFWNPSLLNPKNIYLHVGFEVGFRFLTLCGFKKTLMMAKFWFLVWIIECVLDNGFKKSRTSMISSFWTDC